VDEDAVQRVEGELAALAPGGLSGAARERVLALGREQRVGWRERALAGLMGLSVAAGVAVVVALVSDFWPREVATPAGGAVAERTEEREMRALFERRLARGEWQMEVTYGDR
jgi:hypothetical protein